MPSGQYHIHQGTLVNTALAFLSAHDNEPFCSQIGFIIPKMCSTRDLIFDLCRFADFSRSLNGLLR